MKHMIITGFNIAQWNKDSPVILSRLTPYDAFLETKAREQVKELVNAIRYIRRQSSRPVSKVRFEFMAAIHAQGLQDKMKVSREPIDFLYEVYGSNFNAIIGQLKDSISRMIPGEDYKSCPACSHWLINTGGESWHTKTLIFFFCLHCGGIYEWYRTKDTDKMKRIYRLKTHRLHE